jgi:hypothetical protein
MTDNEILDRLRQVEYRANSAVNALLVASEIGDLGAQLTCPEAECIADLMRALDRADDATVFIRGHAIGDEDSTDLHHDLWLQMKTELY